MAACMEDEQEHPLNKVSLVLNTAIEEKQLMYREDAITRTLSKLYGSPEAVSNWFRNTLGFKLLLLFCKEEKVRQTGKAFSGRPRVPIASLALSL